MPQEDFVIDAFYEAIRAPQYYDFLSPDESLTSDEWFSMSPHFPSCHSPLTPLL